MPDPVPTGSLYLLDAHGMIFQMFFGVGPMNAPTSKPRVAVVFGGRSSEHAISCVTAGSVLQAIDRDKYDVVPVGIATDGRWVLESGDPDRLQIKGPDQLPAVDGERATVALARESQGTDLVVTEASQPPHTLGEVDVVFPLLHGPWGEDGTIQGMFEMAGSATSAPECSPAR